MHGCGDLFSDSSSSVANHDSHVHIASGQTSTRAHRIIYLNSTQPHKYQNNKIRLPVISMLHFYYRAVHLYMHSVVFLPYIFSLSVHLSVLLMICGHIGWITLKVITLISSFASRSPNIAI